MVRGRVVSVTSQPVLTGPKGRVIKGWLCLPHIGVIQRSALIFTSTHKTSIHNQGTKRRTKCQECQFKDNESPFLLLKTIFSARPTNQPTDRPSRGVGGCWLIGIGWLAGQPLIHRSRSCRMLGGHCAHRWRFLCTTFLTVLDFFLSFHTFGMHSNL